MQFAQDKFLTPKVFCLISIKFKKFEQNT